MRGRFLYNKLTNNKQLEQDIRALERHRKRIKSKLNKAKHKSQLNTIEDLNQEYIATLNKIYKLTKMIYN